MDSIRPVLTLFRDDGHYYGVGASRELIRIAILIDVYGQRCIDKDALIIKFDERIFMREMGGYMTLTGLFERSLVKKEVLLLCF